VKGKSVSCFSQQGAENKVSNSHSEPGEAVRGIVMVTILMGILDKDFKAVQRRYRETGR
jgi:hypothetical protein